jgi:hypothetical protein
MSPESSNPISDESKQIDEEIVENRYGSAALRRGAA